MGLLKERIKEQRIKNGMTLLQVAESIGVKEATVQRYESGEIKNLKHDVIEKLAECFNCTPAYLMGWEDENSAMENKMVVPDKYKPVIDSLERAGNDIDHEDINLIANQVNTLIEFRKNAKK